MEYTRRRFLEFGSLAFIGGLLMPSNAKASKTQIFEQIEKDRTIVLMKRVNNITRPEFEVFLPNQIYELNPGRNYPIFMKNGLNPSSISHIYDLLGIDFENPVELRKTGTRMIKGRTGSLPFTLYTQGNSVFQYEDAKDMRPKASGAGYSYLDIKNTFESGLTDEGLVKLLLDEESRYKEERVGMLSKNEYGNVVFDVERIISHLSNNPRGRSVKPHRDIIETPVLSRNDFVDLVRTQNGNLNIIYALADEKGFLYDIFGMASVPWEGVKTDENRETKIQCPDIGMNLVYPLTYFSNLCISPYFSFEAGSVNSIDNSVSGGVNSSSGVSGSSGQAGGGVKGSSTGVNSSSSQPGAKSGGPAVENRRLKQWWEIETDLA